MSATTHVEREPRNRDRLESAVEVSVVMPCLNEARTIGTCIRKARMAMDRMNIEGEIVVADNGSSDGSVQIAEEAGARVVPVDRRGYGAALITGCGAARGRFIVMGDADDSYDFSELAPFIEKLRSGFDLVMGSRLRGKILPGAMPWKNRYIGNPVLTGVLRLLFRVPISDAHCGLRAFTREAFGRMGLRSPGMEFASEMVIRAGKLRLKITEVPIVFHPDGRDRAPHLRPWRDGWRHLKLMLVYSPAALFLLPGVLLLVTGMGLMGLQALGSGDGPVRIFGVDLDFHWALVGSLISLVGYQIVTIHFFAKIYSVTHRLREEDRFLSGAFRILTLGRVLAVAILVMLAGGALDVLVIARWIRSDFGALSSTDTSHFILGSTLIALGVQTFFNAFFFSILGDAYKYDRRTRQ